mgnify:CR=1 FL=1
MKKLAVLLVAAAFIVPVVHGQTVLSKNAVGYVKVTIPPAGGFNLVAFNFRAVGGGDMTIADLFGTDQLTQGIVPTLADLISFWNGATYDSYFQKADGKFYSAADPFGASVNPTVTAGQPFWVQSPSTAVTTNEVYLMGEVVGAASATQSLHTSLNHLNSPFAADLVITNNDYQTEGGTGGIVPPLADQLSIWNGVSYDNYYLKQDGSWGDSITLQDASPVIPVGVGAWYNSKADFTTTLDRPYTYPAD